MKRLLCLLLSALMAVSLCACSLEEAAGGAAFLFLAATNDDRADKEVITQFVTEHSGELLECIQSGDHSAFDGHDIIRNVDVHEDHVDYDCGGAGVGSGTSYRGFFYSPEGDMTVIWCVPSGAKLTPSGDGFEWQEDQGDNWYYVEPICDGFYYYEASF